MEYTSFSFHDLFQRLLIKDKAVSQNHLDLLAESWEKPRSFWEPYFEEHKQKNSFKTHLWQSYDFYYDAVVRHCSNEDAIAFRSYEGLNGWQNLTYKELARRSSILASDWENQSLTQDNTVCLVLPFGSEFVIYLMAALKLGLTIAWVTPEASSYLKNCLDKIEFDYILCPDEQRPFLKQFADQLIIPQQELNPTVNLLSSAYSPGKTVIMLCDPIQPALDKIMNINSEFLFLQCLRDGHLFMELSPGKTFSAPGFHEVLNEPVQLLACLLNGATYIHADLHTFQEGNLSLENLDATTMACSAEFRDHLLEKNYKLQNCHLWFFNLRFNQTSLIWQEFMELQKAENRLCSSTFFAAGDAGCSVYSVKSLTTIPFEVIPVPGVEWSAESILIQGIASNNALSLYLQSNERMSTDRLPSIMLHKQRNKWFYAGTHPRVLDSINLSLDEITNIVRETVPGCTVQIFELIDSWKGSPAKVLLLFSSLEYPEPERKGLERLIKKNIDLELGSLYYIDRIEFFPFMPPFKGGEIDVRKCLGQYQMGLLQKKKQYSFFEELHNLKKLIHEL